MCLRHLPRPTSERTPSRPSLENSPALRLQLFVRLFICQLLTTPKRVPVIFNSSMIATIAKKATQAFSRLIDG